MKMKSSSKLDSPGSEVFQMLGVLKVDSPSPSTPQRISSSKSVGNLRPVAELNGGSPYNETPIRQGVSPGVDAFSSPTEIESAWNSSIARTTTGKSGRVIERLMAENDLLKRELKVETLKREEEQKRAEMARQAKESLQGMNENLIHQDNVNRTALARRERMIADLKADLEHERSLRITAENTQQQLERESDEKISNLKRQVNLEAEKERKATNQYEMLSQTWKRLDEGYKLQVARLQKQMAELQKTRDEETALLVRLEVVVEQQRQETLKITTAHEGTKQAFKEYIDDTELKTKTWRETAERNEAEHERLAREMTTVMGEMRHAIGIKHNVKSLLDVE